MNVFCAECKCVCFCVYMFVPVCVCGMQGNEFGRFSVTIGGLVPGPRGEKGRGV